MKKIMYIQSKPYTVPVSYLLVAVLKHTWANENY